MMKRAIILSAAAALLQGCFVGFVHIPASAPAANLWCVGTDAKIGDRVKMTAGWGTVKSLTGTSSRCTQPEYPILAQMAVE